MAKNKTYTIDDIKRRSVFTAIALSLVTCGIYALYWYVKLTDDSNAIAENTKICKKTASGGKAILFTILSFGIYGLYWAYQLGKKTCADHPAAFLLFHLIGAWVVVYAFAQRNINLFYDGYHGEADDEPKQSAQQSDADVNPFRQMTREQAKSVLAGLPDEFYDYFCALKPGDLVLKIFMADEDDTFELVNDNIKCTFARKDFGYVPRVKNGVPELYISLVPLTEPVKSMVDRVLFQAVKDDDGFTMLKSIADEDLIKELKIESEKAKERILKARNIS